MPTWSTLSFQDRNSPIIEQINEFHNHCITMLTLITFITGATAIASLANAPFTRFSEENQEMEIFWSTIPAGILIIIASPSLKILYLTEEPHDPNITIKIWGHQWYWSYDYGFEFMRNEKFDAYIDPNEEIIIETDKHLILPTKSYLRFLITSNDVIHSWTIPSLSVKVDAVPGRLNITGTLINRPTVIAGQCSEICGANHRFIPISISALTQNQFELSSKERGQSQGGWKKQWPLKPTHDKIPREIF